MATYNKVILLGNLTRAPELRHTQTGTAVCDFGLAVNESFVTKSGESRDETVFVDVTAWGKTAENCAKYLSKGSAVHVDGRLKLEQWEGNDGQKRSKIIVVANGIQFIYNKKQEDQPNSSHHEEQPPEDRIPF